MEILRKENKMRKFGITLFIIGTILLILGIINLIVKIYIDKKCETTTDIGWFVVNCDYE